MSKFDVCIFKNEFSTNIKIQNKVYNIEYLNPDSY